MTKLSLELLWSVAEVFGFTLGTTILSALGVRIELLAVGALSTGQLGIGLWLGLLGGIAFYFGLYVMGLSELFPRVRLLVTRVGE